MNSALFICYMHKVLYIVIPINKAVMLDESVYFKCLDLIKKRDMQRVSEKVTQKRLCLLRIVTFFLLICSFLIS